MPETKPIFSWKPLTFGALAMIATLSLGVTSVLATNTVVATETVRALEANVIQAGQNTTQVITVNGNRYAKGLNLDGQLGLKTGANEVRDWLHTDNEETSPNLIKMSGDWQHTLGIDKQGHSYVWGQNTSGETASSNPNPVVEPTQINVALTYSQIVSGTNFVLALDRSNNLMVWGQNTNNVLGVENVTELKTPTQLLPGVKFKDIAAGKDFAAAIDVNGTLYTWGKNTHGQLGLGDTTDRPVPTVVPNMLFNAVEADRTSETMLAIDVENNLLAWGDNTYGQLGNGVNWRQQQVDENKRVADLIDKIKNEDSVRRQVLIDTCQAERDALVEQWEKDNAPPTPPVTPTLPPVVPNPTPTPSVSPAPGSKTEGSLSVKTVSVKTATPKPEWDNTCAEEVDSTFKPTDTSNLKPAVITEPALQKDSNVPVRIADGIKFSGIAVGSQNSFAIATNNVLFGWGIDESGQSGIGVDEKTHTQVPVSILNGVKIKAVDAGNLTAGAISNSDKLFLWGNGQENGLTLADEKLIAPKDVASGVKTLYFAGDSAYLTSSDNVAQFWGKNTLPLTGDITQDVYRTFQQSDQNLIAVSVTDKAGLGLNTANELITWGDNSEAGFGNHKISKTRIPATRVIVDTFKDIAAGYRFSVIVDTYGKVWAFGKGTLGSVGPNNTATQIPIPTAVPLPVKIKLVSAGQYTSYAVGEDNSIWGWGNGNPNPYQINGVTDKEIVNISANNFAVSVVTADGLVYEWSQEGLGLFQNKDAENNVPLNEFRAVPLEDKIKLIDGGGVGWYGITEKGSLITWGVNTLNADDEATVENMFEGYTIVDNKREYRDVSASNSHALYITENNILYGSGSEPYGTFGWEGQQNENKIKPLSTTLKETSEQ